ncbi:uncharacterized protein PHALS_00011 [Plasmopara halstedii]|uniref:RxLR-like protein n=1 Tax=Plasmopara halstedii TaxID=4781 RepID=A0A0P1ASF8_PLAHL|nr:uncharacterized protein PHALS_00011 [Plasmopara halstedii]CEG44249.1 hypothetical protein PHALS_00011 [Plasmopara halstedii]|eukprot:XP_024580618.1 hypothetical protein PHALS_00011 [Plasmopara halstedii]
MSILCLFHAMMILGITMTKTASSWPLQKGHEGSTTQKLTPPHIKVSGKATSRKPAAKEHLLETKETTVDEGSVAGARKSATAVIEPTIKRIKIPQDLEKD